MPQAMRWYAEAMCHNPLTSLLILSNRSTIDKKTREK